MLVIRLQRTGRRNQPQFRLVVTEKTNGPKSGRFNEILGSYNPKEGERNLKNERIQYWLEQGAQPSGTVHNMLVDAKIIKGDKINVLPQKSPVVDEEAIAAEKEAEEKKKAEAEAAEKAETEEKEEATDEAPAEESADEKEEEKPAEAEEAPAEESKEEKKEESTTDDESTEEAPTEEEKSEESTEESDEDKKEE